MYFAAMIFALMWVVIGDLVEMHIHVIYGQDLYDSHQPYTKSKKADHQAFKVKTQKSLDFAKTGLAFSDFDSKTDKVYFALIDVFNSIIKTPFVSNRHLYTCAFRGPPVA
jgi:hypothetical protein